MGFEIYTKEEMAIMKEFNCFIHKLVYCWDNRLDEVELIENFGQDVSKGLPYIEKNFAESAYRMKTVVVFNDHQGMNAWMRKNPKDQRFIEKDFTK